MHALLPSLARPNEPINVDTDTGLFIKRQIRGHQRGAMLVATAEHLEQELCANRGKWHIAQLINDQRLDIGCLFSAAMLMLATESLTKKWGDKDSRPIERGRGLQIR